MKTIFVREFSEFPGPRYESLGPHSGEIFRKTVLLPAIEDSQGEVSVVLDGVFGYGSSFLDEAFGGMIRDGVSNEIALKICERLVSEDDPTLLTEITQWVKEAISERDSKRVDPT